MSFLPPAAPEGFQSFVKDLGPLVQDYYALTMTVAAWHAGIVDEKVTTANVFCRSLLNNGDTYKDSGTDEIKTVKIPYLVNAGAGLIAEWLSGWRWGARELTFLAQQTHDNGQGVRVRTFPDAFLSWLEKQKLSLDIMAVPEGELIFPQEPVMRLTGPLWQQLFVEANILSLLSSSTNLATVASQVRLATRRLAWQAGVPLIEASALEYAGLADMSLRRAPSIGGLQSARAASIAGWDNTSNVYAGMCYGIPVMGTFAHAWVMLFETEEKAFETWAAAFPGAAVFLVDTYSTIEGIETAIRICKKHDLQLKGVRLDSGNMAFLSRRARALLDKAGYTTARIIATDNISRRAAASLFGHVAYEPALRESAVDMFGIGSEIAVNRYHPLHDFVMKLSAVHGDASSGDHAVVRDVIKVSESEKKTTLPGLTDTIRFIDPAGRWAGDTIIAADLPVGEGTLACDIFSHHVETGQVRPFPKGTPFVRLLTPWMENGAFVDPAYAACDAPAILRQSRARCAETMGKLDKAHLLVSPAMPHRYGWGIEDSLAKKQERAVKEIHHSAMQRQKRRFKVMDETDAER